MYNSTCSRCCHPYSIARYSSAAFCPSCAKAIQDEAQAAQQHRSKIMSGDFYERPDSPAESREVRRAIRSKLTSRPDCQWNHDRKKVAA